MMSDGVNSLTRMYKNNFRDSTKQVSYFLITSLPFFF